MPFELFARRDERGKAAQRRPFDMSTRTTAPPSGADRVETLERVVIRFVGDSGDGMQLTGSKFTEATALAGNDLSHLTAIQHHHKHHVGIGANVSGAAGRLATGRCG